MAHFLNENQVIESTIGVKADVVGRLKMEKDYMLFEVYNNLDHVGHHAPGMLNTGASFSLTPFLNNFIDPIKPAAVVELKGISSTAQVKGV